MLRIERDIAYDIMGEHIERTEEDILAEEENEALIEKSDITALGVIVPEVLVTEGDEYVQLATDTEDHSDIMMETAGKSGSLVEFMQLEDQVKLSTMKSVEQGPNFVGDSFHVDEMADSVGTELTEILVSGRQR